MAILFTDADDDGLTVATAVLTAAPITMACWATTTVSDAQNPLMVLRGTSTRYFVMSTGTSAQTQANTRGLAGNFVSNAGSSADDGNWHHHAAVFAAADSRTAYQDGVAGTEDTNSVTTTVTSTFIGTFQVASLDWDGNIAEAAIWNAALSLQDVESLAIGFSPLLVRPDALVFYLPMIRLGDYTDQVGGLTFTETGTPAQGDHPPNIIYPEGEEGDLFSVAAAAGGVTTDLGIELGMGVAA